MTRFSYRIALFASLALLASLPVAARDIRLQGANGESGTCPDAIAAVDADAGVQPAKAAPKHATTSPKGKTQPSYRSSDNNPVRAPRWHRFIPGMFR